MDNGAPVRVGVVGAGKWGKNHARVMHELPQAKLRWVCDANPEAQAAMREQYPDAHVTGDAADLWTDADLEAVVISSSAVTHAALGRAALEAGKHVLIEKPLALDTGDAEALVALAQERQRCLMVGHLLLYHPAVIELQNRVKSGELGELYYLYSQRVNLGTVREDENALWSFAPHDLSVLLFLLDAPPVSVTARGAAFLRPDIQDVVFMNVAFANGTMGHLQLSWLDPHKLRKVTVVGSKKMAVFDDGEPTEKLRIFDKGADPADPGAPGNAVTLRSGETTVPDLDTAEPLRTECLHFLHCVRTGETPRSDGQNGLEVVRLLQAAQESLDRDGEPVRLT